MRFHLFAGQGYYPQSGLGDYVGGFDSLEEAESAGEKVCGPKPDGHDGYWNSEDWYSVITERDGVLVEVGWGRGGL